MPEHRRQRMGDSRAGHVLVTNTVPTDTRDNRAWPSRRQRRLIQSSEHRITLAPSDKQVPAPS
jgi:hypothetical protein